MSIEIKVPAMGESVTEATVARWLKKEGDAVKQDEPLVELETDKVNVEVPSPAAGVLDEIRVKDGTVNVGTVLGAVREGGPRRRSRRQSRSRRRSAETAAKAEAKPAPKAARPNPSRPANDAPPPMPSARRIAEEEELDIAAVAGTGKRGQVTEGRCARRARSRGAGAAPGRRTAAEPRPAHAREERVPMSRLRRTIAARLKEIAEHRRPAHHLQRSRHDRGDGAARRTTRTISRRSTASSSASWASS